MSASSIRLITFGWSVGIAVYKQGPPNLLVCKMYVFSKVKVYRDVPNVDRNERNILSLIVIG